MVTPCGLCIVDVQLCAGVGKGCLAECLLQGEAATRTRISTKQPSPTTTGRTELSGRWVAQPLAALKMQPWVMASVERAIEKLFLRIECM